MGDTSKAPIPLTGWSSGPFEIEKRGGREAVSGGLVSDCGLAVTATARITYGKEGDEDDDVPTGAEIVWSVSHRATGLKVVDFVAGLGEALELLQAIGRLADWPAMTTAPPGLPARLWDLVGRRRVW